jgi:hypothetical protein
MTPRKTLDEVSVQNVRRSSRILAKIPMNNLAVRHVGPLTRELCKIQGVDQIREQEKEQGGGNQTQGDMAETIISRIHEALGS